MNLRFDKVIRSVGFGFRKVYSLILTDDGLYLIKTGGVNALKHFRLDAASRRAVTDHPDDRAVTDLLISEARLDAAPIDEVLIGDRENYRVRLEAIEDVAIKAGKSPEMLIKVTGSDHYLTFPFAGLEEVQALQRALNKWNFKQ